MDNNIAHIWNGSETIEVRLNFVEDLIKAMRFKADDIHAHADPELFAAVADVLEFLSNALYVKMGGASE